MRQEDLDIGKLIEVRVSSELSMMGYRVTDISGDEFTTPSGSFYSPFDILAESEHYSFVADIKYRKSSRFLPVYINRLKSYQAYIPPVAINDRIVIASFRKLNGMYISVECIANCQELGPYYIVELYQMQSMAVLRKILESSPNV